MVHVRDEKVSVFANQGVTALFPAREGTRTRRTHLDFSRIDGVVERFGESVRDGRGDFSGVGAAGAHLGNRLLRDLAGHAGYGVGEGRPARAIPGGWMDRGRGVEEMPVGEQYC